ncbi:hypothetical protein L6452_28608 [Arctium lappa]|uniref:Uncharacterized protein n=1 Tax=Arctium lappa TaxID=4217 RepID=A0ACB8ZZR3_ARCLA|nr:hypothetical protein L6452_28608 [Arctium lappa]
MSSGTVASSSHNGHGQINPMKDVKVAQDCGVAGSSSKLDNVIRKDENFKKFDIVEDISDHQYATKDMIYVRVYESRMDLLRAVIKGAEGTPYHDGLFFFDVFLPSNYPHVPPGLILNAKPYFNEPGYESTSGSVSGEKHSLRYNEQTLVLSLKTMSYTLRRPPKHFEDLVIDHFRDRAHAILMTCKACCKNGGFGRAVGKGKGKGKAKRKKELARARRFKSDVEQCMDMLAYQFEQLGVKGMEEYKSIGDGVSLSRKVRAFFCICVCT